MNNVTLSKKKKRKTIEQTIQDKGNKDEGVIKRMLIERSEKNNIRKDKGRRSRD